MTLPGAVRSFISFRRRGPLRASLIVDELKRRGVTHVVGLPDNGSRGLFEILWADEELEVIAVTREGEAVAVASGLYLGGLTPVVVIQSTGLLETGDALRGTAYNMGLPLVLLLGYRGFVTLAPGAGRVDTAASFLEPTLDAWDVPYTVLREDGEVPDRLEDAFRTAAERSRPAAVLFVGDTD